MSVNESERITFRQTEILITKSVKLSDIKVYSDLRVPCHCMNRFFCALIYFKQPTQKQHVKSTKKKPGSFTCRFQS